MRALMKKYYNLDFVKPSVPLHYEHWLHFPMGEDGLSKALAVYHDMFEDEDEMFLVVHSSEGYERLAPRQYRGDISIIEFFLEGKYQEETFEALADESWEESKFQVVSISIKCSQVKIESILKEIFITDFEGHSNLASTVFFINRRTHLIYHLYDDRGLDVMGPDEKSLEPLSLKFKDWIHSSAKDGLKPIQAEALSEESGIALLKNRIVKKSSL